MKLVIDIPDEVYNFIIQRGHLPYGVNIAGSIIDGKVLPKGHGDLIDRRKLLGKVYGIKSVCAVSDAPTIIEADNAESEE